MASPLDRLRQDPTLQKSNWDSYNARPVSATCLDRAQKFLDQVQAVPTAAGGVQLEWHTEGIDLELEFYPDGKVGVLLVYEGK